MIEWPDFRRKHFECDVNISLGSLLSLKILAHLLDFLYVYLKIEFKITEHAVNPLNVVTPTFGAESPHNIFLKIDIFRHTKE